MLGYPPQQNGPDHHDTVADSWHASQVRVAGRPQPPGGAATGTDPEPTDPPPPPDLCEYPEPVSCGSHGSCSAGRCDCTGGYTGAACQTPPNVAGLDYVAVVDGVTYAKVAPDADCADLQFSGTGPGALCPSTTAVFSECSYSAWRSSSPGPTTTTTGTTFAECARACTGALDHWRGRTCFAFNFVMAEDPADSTCELISDTSLCAAGTPTATCENGPSRQDITVATATGLKVCYVFQD